MYIGLWLLSADTLAHRYTPHCTPGPSPYIYKRKVQGPRTKGGRAGGQADGQSLSLPRGRLLPPTASASTLGAGQREAAVFPLFVFHLAPTCLGWGTQR
jgi:hypothetical protein